MITEALLESVSAEGQVPRLRQHGDDLSGKHASMGLRGL